MNSLFSKDERIEVSPAFVGYHIMQSLQGAGRDRKSLLDVANDLGKHAWYSPKYLHLGLVFLFSIGAIEFESPYVRLHA